jgi:acetate kinase
MDRIEDFLKELPLLKSFSAQELHELVEKSQVKKYKRDEVIIRFGQPGKFLGIVLSGEAEATVKIGEGVRNRLGFNRPGDILGEMSLLTGEPTSADVIATEETELLLIPQDVFSSYLAVNAEAIQVMAKTMSERLKSRQADEEVQALVNEAWRNSPDLYGLALSTATPMKILVINCGSSSLKFGYFDTGDETNNLEGKVERIGLENPCITSVSRQDKIHRQLGHLDHREALKAVFKLMADADNGPLNSLDELTAVGHRVVHGGDQYGGAVIIDDDVISNISRNASLAPLHNPINLMGIEEAIKAMPGVPQVAVFDTGFHQQIPQHAYMYGLPYEYYEEDRIRRYGFHGISHNYVGLQAATFLKQDFHELKLITCHLGAGGSVCAIDHGRSVDTSMGLTPLEGLIMGTRSGDIDPSIIFYLCKEKGLSIDEVEEILNHKSGLKGLSGISSDFQEIEKAANSGNQRAVITIHSFCYRVRKYIGAYAAAMGGLDALVFTGGIGENSAWVRGLACQGLSYANVEVDDILNRTASPGPGEVAEISGADSRVKVLVIPTDEERMIAREAIRTLGNRNVTRIIKKQQEKKIPIEVSAHHVHLSQEVVERLFGPGHELNIRSELSQPGQFACVETVNLVGPRGRVERVRVLGPVRKQTQVEISVTEELKLGIKAPIRSSGDLNGSPAIILEGQDDNNCEIPEGVICARRHIHMAPEDALAFGLKDRDVVMISVKGDRTLTFGDVMVRVDPNYRLSMHIDTDEANAASITTGMEGYLLGIQDRR